jgi:excisionase family DNA binding protein
MKKELIISEREQLQELIQTAVENVLGEYSFSDKNDEKEIFTNRQAMNYLNVSRSTLQRWRKEGKLPYRKIDSKIFYKKEDINFLLEEALQK